MRIEGRGRSVDWLRIALLLFVAAISCAVGYFFQPKISGNKDAINTIVTVFSILAGFLIAVITFISVPAMESGDNWQDMQLNKRNVRNEIFRHQLLFYCYLVTLGMALAMFLIPCEFEKLTVWLERIFLGLSTFVFIISFKLPGSLMELQMARYEAKLKKERPDLLNKLGQPPNKPEKS